MCIIVYKPIGIDLPDKKTLETCFENNPDGAGFMYRKGREIRIRKGYMNFLSFYRALRNIRHVNGGFKNTDLLLHFRIATHGTIEPGQTHPFPVSWNYTDLVREKVTTRQALAHNGVLPAYTPPTKVKDLLSDTMWFITQNAKDIQTPLKNGLNGKFVLMGTDYTDLYGQFTIDGGVYYSNASYKENYREIWYGGVYGFGYGSYGEYEPILKPSKSKTEILSSFGKNSKKSRRTRLKKTYGRTDWEDRFLTPVQSKYDWWGEETELDHSLTECYYCGAICNAFDMSPCEDGSKFICPDCRDELLEMELMDHEFGEARDYWEGDKSQVVTEAYNSLQLLFPENGSSPGNAGIGAKEKMEVHV